MSSHEIKELLEGNYQEEEKVPIETINYWNEVKKNGGPYLFFPFITHIFVQGRIDISNFEVQELSL